MNLKLIQSLASIIDSLTEEEIAMLETQMKNKRHTKINREQRQNNISPKQKAKLFRQWVRKHRQLQHPHLHDEQISRQTIYRE